MSVYLFFCNFAKISKNAKLDQLTIYQNQLTTLDLTNNPVLTGANAFVTTAFNVNCTSAIESISANTTNSACYTIGGTKVAAPVKGVNISNGKKFVVK